jgi:hypothetical protein
VTLAREILIVLTPAVLFCAALWAYVWLDNRGRRK